MENPPLDKLQLEVVQDGIVTHAPALHAGWAEKRMFITYKQPPLVSDEKERVAAENGEELWLQRMELLRDDLEYLLKLTYHRFWSQVVYHTEVHTCLESYLKLAPRSYDGRFEETASAAVRDAQQTVHRLVFLVYLRMSTCKESESSRITPLKFGTIIYNNFLFDIPILMDLCTLYGRENKQLVEKMVSNIFINQPKYKNDLQEAMGTTIQTLTSIEYKLGELREDEEREVPKKLSDRRPWRDSSELSWKDLLDIVLYLVDIFATLCNFLDVYPKAVHSFSFQGFAERISNFYENVIPAFLREFKLRRAQPDVLLTLDEAKKRLSLVRICMLKTFRSIVETSCFQPILEASKSVVMEKVAEDFLQIVTAVLSERRFVLDYMKRYPFEDDLELLMQADIELDGNRVEYIRNSIAALKGDGSGTGNGREAARKNVPRVANGHGVMADEMRSLSLTSSRPVVANGNLTSESQCKDDALSACAGPAVTVERLQSLVCHVKDVLPKLGEGFVESCLEYFNYDSEKVINAVLEESLPQSLNHLDRQLPRSKEVSSTNNVRVLAERRNVFDYDEFDVFSRDDVDTSRVHRGKWDDDSKPSTASFKSDFQFKNLTLEMSAKYEGTDPLYDDEYNDTYDENMIGTAESTTFDELLDRRPFEVPRILAEKSKSDGRRVEDEDDGKEQLPNIVEEHQRPRDEFCENPALRREREAQKRQQQHPHSRVSVKPRDVKGCPKGQGQAESVLKNRAHKEKNKSSHANHNRRSMADHKRSRGMIPS